MRWGSTDSKEVSGQCEFVGFMSLKWSLTNNDSKTGTPSKQLKTHWVEMIFPSLIIVTSRQNEGGQWSRGKLTIHHLTRLYGTHSGRKPRKEQIRHLWSGEPIVDRSVSIGSSDVVLKCWWMLIWLAESDRPQLCLVLWDLLPARERVCRDESVWGVREGKTRTQWGRLSEERWDLWLLARDSIILTYEAEV